MRNFKLVRTEDVSGVSGLGIVADGCIFPDGVAVLRWRTAGGSTAVYDSIESVERIHGHDGKTKIELEVVPEPNAEEAVKISASVVDKVRELFGTYAASQVAGALGLIYIVTPGGITVEGRIAGFKPQDGKSQFIELQIKKAQLEMLVNLKARQWLLDMRTFNEIHSGVLPKLYISVNAIDQLIERLKSEINDKSDLPD